MTHIIRILPKAIEATRKYRQIVEEIIDVLKTEKPKTMIAVCQMLEDIHNPESFYGLLVGEIQSGKTPAQMILTWIFTRHPDLLGRVCFVTKCLDSIRRDIMSKFESDLINKHIIAVCARHGIKPSDAIKQFGLTYHIYNERNLTRPGQVEVMLMQKQNFEYVRMWYADTAKSNAPVLFLVDEMHEMYAGAGDLMENNGLSDPNKIGNIGMLHWFNMKREEQARRCYLIGVTATPFAPMSADPVCWPKKVYQLTTDAPAPGLTYYGYFDHVLTDDIAIETFNSDIIVDLDAINYILEQPRTQLENGNTEVPFICISTRMFNDEHTAIEEMIYEAFGNRVNVLVFNQETNTPLSSWFTPSMLTQDICETGALVIIGRNSMAAGITIKPSGQLTANWNNTTYQVTGITEQFMPTAGINITATKQLMRILGWFPNGHRATLWVHTEELKPVYKHHIGDVSRQFISNYDEKAGPMSVQQITLADQGAKHIKSFYSSDPYMVSSRFGAHLHYDNEQPMDCIELETESVCLGDLAHDEITTTLWERFADRTINSFYHSRSDTEHKNEQHTLRKMITSMLHMHQPYFQIGYELKRYDDIIKSALKPGNTEQWRVNSFLWGNKGPHTQLKDCYVITFTEAWEVRPQEGQDDESVAFKTPDGKWYYLKDSKERSHKYMDKLENPVMSELHYKILETLDTITAEKKQGVKLSAWSLFMKCWKLAIGSGSVSICSKMYPSYSGKFNQLTANSMSIEDKLRAGMSYIKPVAIPVKKLPRAL